MDWAQAYGEALARASDVLGEKTGADAPFFAPGNAEAGREIGLTEDETTAVLQLARVVAHGSERRNAPLATYLAGQFVLDQSRGGVPVIEALARATALAEGLLPPPADR